MTSTTKTAITIIVLILLVGAGGVVYTMATSQDSGQKSENATLTVMKPQSGDKVNVDPEEDKAMEVQWDAQGVSGKIRAYLVKNNCTDACRIATLGQAEAHTGSKIFSFNEKIEIGARRYRVRLESKKANAVDVSGSFGFDFKKAADGVATTSNESNGGERSLSLLSKECDPRNCLVDNDRGPVGYGVLEGFYEQKRRERPWRGGTTTCQLFHVTEGSDVIIDYFMTKIEEGNTVQEKAEDGHLLLNLPYKKSEEVPQELKNTRAHNTITIQVLLRARGGGTEASACHAFVDDIII